MVSLWGSKKNDDPNPPLEHDDDEAGDSRLSQADERTRLLPPPAQGGRDGYLSPDDPAVSH